MHATEEREDGGPRPQRGPSRRWLAGLLLVVLAGLGMRAAYVVLVLDPVEPGLDAVWYALQASGIEDGHGYVQPYSLFSRDYVPTAAFPPGYPTFQAAWQALGADSLSSVRLAGLVPAAFTIALTGVLARRVVGPRAALLAAAVVALDPALVGVDGSGMSENLTVPLVLVAVLLAHVLLVDGLRVGRLLALALVCGLATLTRQDLGLLVPLLLLPVVVWAPAQVAWPRRAGVGVLGLVAVATVVVPWAWRNLHQVDSFTISTLSPSSAVAGANCDSTYSFPDLGSWDYDCVHEARPASADEDDRSAAYRQAASTYVHDHITRVPIVLAARQARAWSFWDPVDLARRDSDESRRFGWQLAARPIEALMVLVGAVGLVGLVRRRGATALVLCAPIVIVVLSTSASYGNPRFNAIAHPVLAIGVAWVVTTVVARRAARRHVVEA